jgi:diguanylate cyclase (GGDEF)-like protein
MNKKIKDQLKATQQQLQRARQELLIFYEVSNALRSTLKLEHILYIILTSVTAKGGLGFDRAFLFLVNEEKKTLDGRMAIGPKSGKEANQMWQKIIKLEKEDLTGLIALYKKLNKRINKGLTDRIRKINIPLSEEAGIPALTALENMPHKVEINKMYSKVNKEIREILKPADFVAVPLTSGRMTQGVILADNIITAKPITQEDIRILTLFANQAGLAIENSKHYEYTKMKANTDALTNLYNHGRFQKLLVDEFARARRYKSDLSLLFMDLDNFKKYNDQFGHLAGDRVLISIADILRKNTRKLDIVARYGGEEFAIILPSTKEEESLELAERIRKATEDFKFKNQEKSEIGNLTISIGVASLREGINSKEELIEKADNALYEAKGTGKNKVKVSR